MNLYIKVMDEDQKSMDEAQESAENVKQPFKRGVMHIALELFATVFILGAIFVGLCVWRLSSGEVDLAFAKPTIKEALRDPQSGMNIDYDKAVLRWPDLSGPLLLGLSGGKVFDGSGNLVVAIDSAAISLNKGKLLLAQVSPEGLILQNPSVLVKRSKDNQFSIGLTGIPMDGATVHSSAAISLDDVLGVFKPADGSGAENAGRLAKLKLVQIEGARVLIDDQVLSRSWQVPRVDVSLMRERGGMRVRYDIDLPRLPKTPAVIVPNVKGSVFAGWGREEMQIESVLSQFHTRFLSDKIPELEFFNKHDVRLNATAKAVLGRDFSLLNADISAVSGAGELNIPEFDDAPLVYKNLGFKAIYDVGEGVVKIDGLKITTGGVDFTGQSEITHPEGGFSKGFDAKGRVDVPKVSHEQIVALWPKALDDDKSKEWIIDKLSNGRFQDFYASFEVAGAPDDKGELSVDLNQLKAGFNFENLTAKYKETMAPATNGVGKGVFDYKSATIRIDLSSAKILDMSIPKASLVFENIIVKDAGQADLSLSVNGPFQSMLRYLYDEPIGVRMDCDLDDVKGDIKADINLKFPTREGVLKEEIEITIDGVISNMYLPQVIQDFPLSSGPFKVSVKDGVFGLSGKGKLDGRAIDLDYREYLFSEGKPYSSKTLVKMTADEKLRDKLGVDLSDFMRGPAPIDVVYTKSDDGSAVADIKADITNAVLFLNPFDFEKPAGSAGDVTLKAHLKNDDLVRISKLRLNAPDVALEPSSLVFRKADGETKLAGGKINQFKIGETKGRLDFEMSQAGVLNLSMDASFLDLRPFLSGDDDDDAAKKENPPMKISVNAGKIRTADDGMISAGKIFADLNAKSRFNQLELDATAGSGALYLRFKPDVSGKRIFRLEADDAGAVLSAFELYDNVRGGKLIIHGEPISGNADRNLVGKAQMSNFRVVKAPGLARILGAMSLPGATEMLAGDGLVFSKLEADFDWMYRADGSMLVVNDGRTSGNSLGLTFKGTYDHKVRKIDIGGTIIPLSGLNNILKDIPLVGNILGGSSGLFAATYSIKGEGKEPSVSVNPLSVLAPGILRSILFEGGAASIEPLKKSVPQKVPHVAE